jgi:glycine/D-amino acid oxidase-like deaminating enzyme
VVEAKFEVESHVIGPAEVARLLPRAAPVEGAVYCPVEGRIDPLRATLAVLRLAGAAGARILAGAEVTGLTRDGAGWRVATAAGSLAAGRVVIAAGAGSGRIAALAGVDLPVRGTVQQVIVTEPAPPMVHHLVAVADRHLSLKQQANGSLLIGGGWFGRFDPGDGATRALRGSIQGNLWVTASILPDLSGLHMLRAWTGLAPSVDGAPILGEVPGQPGLFIAAGANGLTLAPILGRLTAEAVRGCPPDPRLRLERFG